MFQDGQIGSLTPASRARSWANPRRAHARFLGRRGGIDSRSRAAFLPARQPMLTSTQHIQHAGEGGHQPGRTRDFQSLPPQQFQVLLTLFSKFFSSFPHGTCSLSVSRQYLALDGIYHLLRAAFPNNPTLRKRLVECPQPEPTGFSPSATSLSRELGPGPIQRSLL